MDPSCEQIRHGAALDYPGTERADRRVGHCQVILHVDSSNEHDAPSVYRRAGFEVRCAFNAFARDLFEAG